MDYSEISNGIYTSHIKWLMVHLTSVFRSKSLTPPPTFMHLKSQEQKWLPILTSNFMGTPQHSKFPLPEKAFCSIPETYLTEIKRKNSLLIDLFRDSFDARKSSNDQNASGKPLAHGELEVGKTKNLDGPSKYVNGTPVLSETNSESSSERSPDRVHKPDREKLSKVFSRYQSRMVPSCRSFDRKKRHIMSHVRNDEVAYNSFIA
ncbi:hypothetical protein MKX01_026370 [Papaver californicum]|nr:hypothetical protein MKX01_026370 [Papaver californicum]